jgi:hypothetical protein
MHDRDAHAVIRGDLLEEIEPTRTLSLPASPGS